jgi:hypothetical protein
MVPRISLRPPRGDAQQLDGAIALLHIIIGDQTAICAVSVTPAPFN